MGLHGLQNSFTASDWQCCSSGIDCIVSSRLSELISGIPHHESYAVKLVVAGLPIPNCQPV